MVRSKMALTYLVLAYLFAVFGYGLIKYPDAPLHPCTSAGYCGKQGQAHGAQQYQQFSRWQATFEWSWPIGMLALYLLNRDRIPRRRPA